MNFRQFFRDFLRSSLLFAVLFGLLAMPLSAQLSENDEEKQDAIEKSETFLELKRDINLQKSELDTLLINESLLEERLSEVSDEVETLEDQLKSIDRHLESTSARIRAFENEISENEKEIRRLDREIADLESEIETQKEKYAELLLILYFENESAGFFDSDDLQTIKLLLNNDDVTEVLERSESIGLLEFALKELLVELDDNKGDLRDAQKELEDVNVEVLAFKTALDQEKAQLTIQRDSKQKVLDTTRGEEEIYRELIRRAKEEQIRIRRDINSLILDYAKYKSQFGIDGFGEDDFGISDNDDKLSWPIIPDIGISAYFRDPSYKAALGVEHNAIDIRAGMQTEVNSAADGVVLKVKGGEGLDYHYIIVGHNGGLMTLYGHMYDIFVTEGEPVRRGQLIGLSGGMPGSRGAGWLTTGPHLHFEVFLNGVHIDPLKYLDLSYLPEKYLP